MRRRSLLIAGVAALVVSLVGAGVQAAVTESPDSWRGHMFGGETVTNGEGHMFGRGPMTDGGHMMGNGHMFGNGPMGWWGNDEVEGDQSAADPIEGAREIVVTATDFAFAPADLTITAGEPVNLTFRNEGRLVHDFVIPDLDVHVSAGPGEEATTGIVLDEPGTFDIICTLPGHAAAGMTGMLEVQAG